MAGIGPEEAGRLTYWQFTAMRHIWNLRHKGEGDEDIEAPDLDTVQARHAELYASGIAGKAKK